MTLSGQGPVQVRLNGVHLCCGGCTDAVANAVKTVPGASCQSDMDHRTVTVSAPDRASARKALDAIADAGLHGETGDPDLAMKTERDVPPGKVRRLTLSGIHNCCDLCSDAIKGAVGSVEGVQGDTASPKQTTFEVTGNFSAAELLQSLNAAGFHAKVMA